MHKQTDATAQKHRVIKELFAYIYLLRYKRQPYEWELLLGEALVKGELKVIKPPSTGPLRMIHHVAEDVDLALVIPDLD